MKQGIERTPVRWTPRARRLGRGAELVAVVLCTGAVMALVCALAWMTMPGGVR